MAVTFQDNYSWWFVCCCGCLTHSMIATVLTVINTRCVAKSSYRRRVDNSRSMAKRCDVHNTMCYVVRRWRDVQWRSVVRLLFMQSSNSLLNQWIVADSVLSLHSNQIVVSCDGGGGGCCQNSWIIKFCRMATLTIVYFRICRSNVDSNIHSLFTLFSMWSQYSVSMNFNEHSI